MAAKNTALPAGKKRKKICGATDEKVKAVSIRGGLGDADEPVTDPVNTQSLR